jgi:protein-S-isoprenylcysteine O-methyltransferase Ste14
MKELNRRAFEGLAQLIVALAAMIFLPAWTIHYWQAWVFLAVFSISVLAITLYLMQKDPRLLEKRVNAGSAAEKEVSQKIIQLIASIAFILIITFPAIDHRFGWSKVPTLVVISGDLLVALGLLFVFFVFKENTYTSAVIEVDTEQTVISTGPYAIVRHPMYISALAMLAGIPLALGSFWGLFTVIPITITIVWRLLEEEVFLAKNLPGYAEYRSKVRYRLLPFVW